VTEVNSSVFRFEGMEVRESEYSLTRAGTTVTVEPTAFRVLVYLLRNAGRLVTKDEIIHAVWHGSAVSDNSLTRAVATLRRLLGDNSRDPRLIATVQTIGYKFLVPVETISANGAGGRTGAASEPAETPIYKDGLTPEEAGQTPDRADSGSAPNSVADSAKRPRRHALRWVVAVCGVALLLAVAVIYLIRKTNTRAHEKAPPAFSTGTAKSILEVPGLLMDAALSPDGRQLAFVWKSEAQPQNVYVQLIGADQRLQLTHYTSGYVCCTNWSPDGSQIVYGRCEDGGAGVYIVPALGGPERKITDVMCAFGNAGFPQWADGGRTLVLADRCTPGAPRGIVAFSLETGERRCLASPPAGGDDIGDAHPAVSPDQKTVAFVRASTLARNEIYAVDLSGKHLRQLTNDGKGVFGSVMWAPDGKHILFGRPDPGGLWQVPIDGGPIESAASFPNLGSLSRDGRLMAYYTLLYTPVNTWQVRLKSPGGRVLSLKQITTASLYEDSPQLSPDAKQLAIRSFRGSLGGLWKSDIEGNNYVLLQEPKAGFLGSPHWSPDAKWIAMDYRPGHHSQIYLVDSEGRNFHALTSGDYENEVPRWSRDGRSIYFSSNRTGEWQLWRRDMATGHETQITQHGGISAFESSDRATLYYANLESGGLWQRPVAGGPEERISGALHLGYWGAFAVTDAGIYLLDADAAPRPSIVYYDFKTRKTKPVLTLDHLPIAWVPSMTASRDGLLLLFSQSGEALTQINLAESAP
jgi:Tol biopolymer transport system component/DNA-binding winged helix-turn-helix (wHTH) protein